MTREEAIKVLKEYLALDKDIDNEYLEAQRVVIKAMEQVPKIGHWIREKERHFLDTRTNVNVEMKEATGKGYHTYINVQCSECRMITIHDDSIFYQYCPHCGEKMEWSEEE